MNSPCPPVPEVQLRSLRCGDEFWARDGRRYVFVRHLRDDPDLAVLVRRCSDGSVDYFAPSALVVKV